MLEIIALIILFCSTLGLVVILYRKIPILAELPLQKTEKLGMFQKVKIKMKNNGFLKQASYEIILQKLLSKVRILILKTDNQTSNWLGKLRQRTVERRKIFQDDYWQKIKIKRRK